MTNSYKPTRVLAITDNQRIWVVIKAAMMKEQDFSLLGNSSFSEGVLPAVETLKPDIILLDYEYDTENLYKTIDQLTSQSGGGYAVVVIMPQEEVQQSNKVILAGARAFMLYPFSQIDLLSTLRRVRELLARAPAAAASQEALQLAPVNGGRHLFVVYSPKGGVGCTSVATNLAIALHREIGDKVLLVDGKHQFGHVSVLLNLRTVNSIADLIAYAGTLDAGLVRQVVTPYNSGLEVLPSPVTISEGQGIRPDDLYKVILALQDVYPHIVVDGGSHLSENAVTYMDAAFRVVLVITPDLAALRDARQFLEICRTLSYPREKILLVLNQTGRKNEVKIRDVEQVLQSKIYATIPSDGNIMLNALNEGVPIMHKKPNHAISKAIRRLARNLAKMTAPSAAPQTSVEDQMAVEVLAKTSRLG